VVTHDRLDVELGSCPRCGGPTVTVEVRRLYDGAAYYQCDRCDLYWSRRGTPLTIEQVAGLTCRSIFEL